MPNVSAISTKSKVSEQMNEVNAEDVERPLERPTSAMSANSDASARSRKSERADLHARESVGITDDGHAEEENEERAQSTMSVKTAKSNISAKSSKSFGVPNKESDDSHEEEIQCAIKYDEAEARASTEKDFEINGENHKQTEERVASSISHVSERSFTSQVSGVTTEDVVEHEPISERTPSALSVKSARSNATVKSGAFKEKTEDNVEQVSTAVPAKSKSPGTSAKACLEKETEERSQSTMSVQSTKSNMSLSSRGTSASEGPSEENVGDDEDIVQRPPSTLSNKSSRSAKSTHSNILSKSQACNAPGDKNHKENIGRAPSSSSIISTKSGQSNSAAISMELKASGVPAEDCANITDTEGQTGKRATSSVSAKSLKSNVTSLSTKSKASHISPSINNEEDAEDSRSVLSVKSDVSARTSAKSSVSGITPCERTGHEEQTDERPHSGLSTKSKKSNNSTKSNILKTPDIPVTESSHNEANAEKKSGRASSAMSAKSTMSVRSEKSKVLDILADTRQEEGRTPSPVSAHSNTSEMLSRCEVPAVTVEKSEERSPTVLSSKSRVSAHSKKSFNKKEKKSEGQSQVSLSVKSDLSKKSRKSKVTDTVTIEDLENKKKSEMVRAVRISAEQKTTASNESDLSQTLSSSDVVKEIPVTGESKSTVSEGIINGPLEITDNKMDDNTDTDDFELVPSRLPNASPTEVVNEWLKTIPTESDMYEMEELSKHCEADTTDHATEEIHKQDNNDSADENTEYIGVLKNSGPNIDCHTGSEAPNEDNTSTQRDDASKVFHSSVQVMKVLLNPKLDRCNSLPEVSPVYGRKLSTSARGLLDCLVKLQLIEHDPKNANEMAKRYQELMNILQSLWLCDPPENKQVIDKCHHHSVDNECNHTSSSGVDVNSGSTGSGKSSDGVKRNDGGNRDTSQPPAGADTLRKVQDVGQAENERTSEREVEGMHEENQKEDDPATDDTIRSNESPKELPETPPSSNKSSENDSNAQKHSGEVETECAEDIKSESPLLVQRAQLANRISQDPDPVWVLKLLTKIEKQFMAHYINAMREFKVRWNLDDNEQLNMMIGDLETEVRKRIQRSIDRELRKIQGRAGLPRPPKETMSRTSTTQTEERRQRLKIMLKQSIDTQTEKSNDSATGTSYSDQRSEEDVEYCPCETCIRKKVTSKPPLPILNAAPVILDFDLKRILVMKNSDPAKAQALACASHDEYHIETTAAVTLVERAIVKAVREVENDEEHYDTGDNFRVVLYEKEAESAAEITMSEDAVVVSGAGTADELNEESDDVTTTEGENAADDVTSISKHESDESEKEELVEEGMDNQDELEDEAAPGDDSAEEETTEDEIAIKKETAITCKDESKDNDSEEAASGEESSSAREDDSAEDGPGNEDEAAGVNYPTGNEWSKEPTEEAITEDEHSLEMDTAVTSEDEPKEEAVEATTTECKIPEETLVVTTSEDESNKEETAEEGTEDNEDELASTSAEESAHDNYGTAMPGDVSEEPNEEAETGDETAALETSVAAITENESDKEEADGGEEAVATSDNDFTNNAMTNEARIAEDDATGDKLPEERAEVATEKDTDFGSEDESNTDFAEACLAAEDSDVTATTVNEPDKNDAVETEVDDKLGQAADTSDEDETTDTDKAATAEYESGTEKDNALTGEDESEDSSAAEEANAVATTNHSSDKDAAVEKEILATSVYEFESDEQETAEKVSSEDENGKDIETAMTSEDEIKTEAREATTADMTNAVKYDADTTEHESDEDEAAKEEEICQPDESNQEEMEETTSGEEPVDPEQASGKSYKSATENESEEESYESDTDKNKSESNTVTDANESARDEDISNVSNDNESGDEHLGAKPENKTVDETAEDDKPTMDENNTLSEKEPVEMAPSTVDAVSHTDELVETAGDESEEADNESEMFAEHKSGTEAVTTGDETEEHETAEDSGEPETAGNETTESDGGEEGGTQGISEGDEECTEDESAQDEGQQLTDGEDEELLEDLDKAKQRSIESDITEEHQEGPNDETEGPDDVVELKPDEEVEDIKEDDVEKADNTLKEENENDDGQTETNIIRNGSHDSDEDNVQAFEKEEEETETPNESWCRIQGDSADGEDEAEEDSDGPEKETDDEEQDLVSSKTRDKLVSFNRAAEETTLIPLDTLIKVNAESEDGAYADVEDSETELYSQEDIPSLETKKI
ncbi:retinitis pigmentosa 1-like 1 protein [Channa argus]|uniref:retinitis pigmentosa 1-like 1 protein n=1 Tax=Channa argus TaxID=215402 RepID=UPI003521F720